MRKVAVVGVGETKFSGPQPKTSVELFSEAAMDAINGSNLKPKDIQALFVGNVLSDFSEGQGMVQAFSAENIGCFNVPANRYEGACASASMAVRDAFVWVASGFYDIVLVGGTERAATMGTPLATRTFAMFSDARYEFPAGITFPAVFAMLAHLYAAKYGIPLPKLKEQLAQVSVQSYKRGLYNPKAHLHKEVS
ncbi:propanoyl-CoA acyltransferase, partial [Chloroflexota bacterium]